MQVSFTKSYAAAKYARLLIFAPQPLEPGAFTSPLVEALSQLQRAVAQGHKGLGWFDRQELGHHLRRFAIRQEAAESRRTLHQFRRRLIRADIAQDCPGITKMR